MVIDLLENRLIEETSSLLLLCGLFVGCLSYSLKDSNLVLHSLETLKENF